MNTTAYEQRRSQIEHYFDRTAADAWARLTSNEPVGRIRATVRAGRDTMRETLLSWLPQDMLGLRVLDAGCGTGALALQAALRGAEVVAIDLSPTLVKLAAERMAAEHPRLPGSVQFCRATCSALSWVSLTMWCAWTRSSTTTASKLPKR